MEVNETVFRKQLITARIELEKRTKTEYQPARELDEYSISTVPYLTSRPGAAVALEGEAVASEKQGWLFMRTLAGKPTRSVWIRRWFFVQSGTFGWLVQGYRGGGVEESEKVGVLLCNVKPAFQEERRFCFEVKTKDTTILLQTETQADLTSWLAVFEQAKRTAVEGTSLITSSQAFSILPPSVPAPPSEPAYVTKGHGSNSASSVIPVSNDRVPNVQHLHHLHHQDGLGFERATTMGPGTFGRGPSMDVMREGEATIPEPQESAIQKTGRKPSFTSGDRAPLLPGLGGPSGISALIAASHNALPFQADSTKFAFAEHYKSAEQHKPLSLTPNTLSSTPSPANLLTSATVTSGNGVTGTTEGSRLPEKGHRKAISLDIDSSYGKEEPASEAEYFPGYPVELKYQDAHFRMLFPGTKDHVVLLGESIDDVEPFIRPSDSHLTCLIQPPV